MHIVIAPDSFKESLTAMEAAQAMAEGFLEIFPDADCRCVPMADGGEGTVQAIISGTGGRLVELEVTGPLGAPVKAFFGLSGDGNTAIIEMAAASGLALVPPAQRNPLHTTSRGTGELMLKALDMGAKHLILGLGGSATNDAGVGMLTALGVRFTDANGQEIELSGGGLEQLAHIDASNLDPRPRHTIIDVACDVTNPLCGPRGASAVFGPQKGATPEMVTQLDANLAHFAKLTKTFLPGNDCADMADFPGAGAAGGMGGAFRAYLHGAIRPGCEIVAEAVGLDAAIAQCDLVITGEGRMDSQTLSGKTPLGVARVARKHGKPVIGIAGCLGPGVEVLHNEGFAALFSATQRPAPIEKILASGRQNVRQAARAVAATLQLGRTA